MQLANVLDTLMIQRNISAYKISKDTGISDRLIGYWRKGEKTPSAENLLTIATYFGISTDFLLTGKDYNKESPPINPITDDRDEQEVLQYFRVLGPKDKGRVLGTAKTLVELQLEKQRTLEYSTPKELIYIDNVPVSAGTGEWLSETTNNKLKVRSTAQTEKADFALRINGNSMEPQFYDDDIILVHRQETVTIGEIGIFVLNGYGYIKKYDGNRLVSLNPAFDDILITEHDNIVCQGKVLGILPPDDILLQ